MRRPKHGILLDEPALGQDTAHKDMLMCLVHGLANAGQLVILTTHDLALAGQADRLLLLAPEGWVADGSPAEVMNDHAPWDAVGLPVPSWVLPPATRRLPDQGGRAC
jgi:energy-coupling factor transport system ATP-binding protein